MKKILVMIILLGFLYGCAWIPVRPALQEDISAPAGKVEGNQFTGIRYSFKVSAPPHWKVTTEFPDFMEKLGYDKPFSTDKEQTELYARIIPKRDQRLLLISRRQVGMQDSTRKKIELLTSMATESMKAELDKEFGKGVIKPDVFCRADLLKRCSIRCKKICNLYGKRYEAGTGMDLWIYRTLSNFYYLFII